MTTKNNQQPTKAKDEKLMAEITLSPSVNAAAIITNFKGPFGKIDMFELNELLKSAIEGVNGGNMNLCEGMLLSQAHALQSIFMNLCIKANAQTELQQHETFYRLALKAQSQCRATIEALATIKNPPVVFAKQANITNGPQQINNGSERPAPRAKKIKNQPNELLEVQHGGKTLDTGTTSATIGKNKTMATLDSVNGGEIRHG